MSNVASMGLLGQYNAAGAGSVPVDRRRLQSGRRRWAAIAAIAVVSAVACVSHRGGSVGPSTDLSEPVRSTAVPSVLPGGPGTPAPRPLAHRATLTIARSAIAGVAPFASVLLAQELGEFAKENLDVRFVFANVVDTLALIQQGRLDGGYLGFGAGVLNALAAGADVRFVLPTGSVPAGDPSGFWARKGLLAPDGSFDPCVLGRGARSNGKTVLSLSDPTGLGSQSFYWLLGLVAQCPGLSMRQVADHLSVSLLAGPNQLIALQQGAIDIGFLFPPLTSAASLRQYAGPIYPIRPSGPAVDFSGWALGAVRHQQPAVADAFVRAVVRTARTYLQGDYRTNADTMSALSKVLEIPPDLLRGSPALEFSSDQKIGTVALAPVQAAWVELGNVLSFVKPLDGAMVVDSGPIDRVLSER